MADVTGQGGWQEELSSLLSAVCDGRIDEAGSARLEALLAANSAARRWYLGYLDLHVDLSWDHLRRGRPDVAEEEAAAPGMAPSVTGAGLAPAAATMRPRGPHAAPADLGYPSPAGGAILCHYLIAVLLLGAGVLFAWTWGGPSGGTRGILPHSAAAQPVALVNALVDCRWAEAPAGADGSGPALQRGAPLFAGRRIALRSGVVEIMYLGRGEVILQGPVDYTVESANGGFLAAGRATVRLVKDANGGKGDRHLLPERPSGCFAQKVPVPFSPGQEPPPGPAFTVRTPASLVTNLGAESGADLAASTEFAVETNEPQISRTCVFRGKVAVELRDGGASLPAVRVDAGRSAVAEGQGPGRQGTIFIDESLGDPRRFAHRVLAPIEGQQRQAAWLKAVGTGLQTKLVAVGSGEDIDPPPVQGPSPDGRATSADGLGMPAAITYTCRLSFDLRDLSPDTAMLQLLYVARDRIAAVRLNGKAVPRKGADGADRRLEEVGQFNIRGGVGPEVFVRGVNTLEIDVDAVGARRLPLLRIRPEITGIWVPQGG